MHTHKSGDSRGDQEAEELRALPEPDFRGSWMHRMGQSPTPAVKATMVRQETKKKKKNRRNNLNYVCFVSVIP
jgi:hypothetical protein